MFATNGNVPRWGFMELLNRAAEWTVRGATRDRRGAVDCGLPLTMDCGGSPPLFKAAALLPHSKPAAALQIYRYIPNPPLHSKLCGQLTETLLFTSQGVIFIRV